MSTNRMMELAAAGLYPTAMKYFQQLLMDSERCAKSIGKRTWLGGDKFQESFIRFRKTINSCALAMAIDDIDRDPADFQATMEGINFAFGILREAYSNWPLAFEFWDSFYEAMKAQEFQTD